MPGTGWFDLTRYSIRSRPDLSPSVTHWTKSKGESSAFDVFKSIANDRKLIASTSQSGFIKGSKSATCFTETPMGIMTRLFRVVESDEASKKFIKWEPYGFSFLKPTNYNTYGGRPVINFSREEYDRIIKARGLEDELAWRVVTLEHNYFEDSIDWSHEREWRVPSDVDFGFLKDTQRPLGIVNLQKEKDELYKQFPPGTDSPFRGIVCNQDFILT